MASREAKYEVTRDQLAAHIDYDSACEIADAGYSGDTDKQNQLIQNSSEPEKVQKIVDRINEVCQ